MSQELSDHVLLNRLSIVHLLSRSLLLLALIALLLSGGYDSFEFFPILFTILPITVLYMTAFIRFAMRFPYSVALKKLSPLAFGLPLALAVMLYLITFSVILLNPWFKETLTTAIVHWTVVSCEAGHAILIATNLTSLLEIREPS